MDGSTPVLHPGLLISLFQIPSTLSQDSLVRLQQLFSVGSYVLLFLLRLYFISPMHPSLIREERQIGTYRSTVDLISDPRTVSKMLLYNLLRKKVVDSTSKF